MLARLAWSVCACLCTAGTASKSGHETFPAFTWPNQPPADIPFERSTLFTQVEFTGRYAKYGNADTWYPSWGADGNLYTPWTDGRVNNASAFSGCPAHPKPGCLSTTGWAVVAGDDPLNLTILDEGTVSASPLPYHGRYPSASLYYKGVWFYGTYALDDNSGYCQNWCVQGPFAGFRWSLDQGKTWTEPKVHMKDYCDNVFGECAPNNYTQKVKYGAPHVVDLGRELEHRPSTDKTDMMYVVGHGANKTYSPTAWMQGSEVYMARVSPTIDAVQDRSQWEFYAGSDQWVKGDVYSARPVISWGNRTGVTTMTYLPAVRRYLVCISTPTASPFTTGQFDTYLLESESMTGPFRYITYMQAFGPEGYFVNVPSKFVASALDAKGALRLYLGYSANFAHQQDPGKPLGSSYHWVLQEVLLKPQDDSSHSVVV